jgi:hypothetical protein
MVRPGQIADSPETLAEAKRLDVACRAKAKAELAAAEKVAKPAGGVRGRGDVLAAVLLLKGEPGPEEREAHAVLAGADGPSIGKALEALGLPSSRYAACTSTDGSRNASLKRLRLLVEAVDPRMVVLLDPAAAADFAEAFGHAALVPGEPVLVLGRTVLALDDFAASLGDERAKRRVWQQLQSLAPAE